MYFSGAEVMGRLSRRWSAKAADLERRGGLPGFYNAEAQRIIWNRYDWSRRGDEWTASEAWKRSIVEAVMKPNVHGGEILEIGPGGGRWSTELASIAHRLTLVDLSQSCINETRKRLGNATHVGYVVNDGRSLPFVENAFDAVWSFDVFVHIGESDTAAYVDAMMRVLKPGGRAVIHHPGDGGLHGHWRSGMSSERFAQLATHAGLHVDRQFDEWTFEGVKFDARETGDTITILSKSVN